MTLQAFMDEDKRSGCASKNWNETRLFILTPILIGQAFKQTSNSFNEALQLYLN